MHLKNKIILNRVNFDTSREVWKSVTWINFLCMDGSEPLGHLRVKSSKGVTSADIQHLANFQPRRSFRSPL